MAFVVRYDAANVATLNRYDKKKIINSGSFGNVWLVKSRLTKHSYVMKEINLASMSEIQRQRSFTEMAILSKCDHKNIISYKDALFDEESKVMCIFMEYADGGNLCSAIMQQNGVPFSEQTVISWFVQICLALQYIHRKRILHRDLKSKNIFLTRDNIIKIGDFGIAKILQTEELATTLFGAPHCVPPEICQRKPYNYKSDMWSLGCVLFELEALDVAFKAHSYMELASMILSKYKPQLPSDTCPIVKDLVDQLLSFDPRERPSIDEILNLIWLQPYLEEYTSMPIMRDGIFEGISRRNSPKYMVAEKIGNTPRRTPSRSAVNQQSGTMVSSQVDSARNRKAYARVPTQSSKQVMNSPANPSVSISCSFMLDRGSVPPKLLSFDVGKLEAEDLLNDGFSSPHRPKDVKNNIRKPIVNRTISPSYNAVEYSVDLVPTPGKLEAKNLFNDGFPSTRRSKEVKNNILKPIVNRTISSSYNAADYSEDLVPPTPFKKSPSARIQQSAVSAKHYLVLEKKNEANFKDNELTKPYKESFNATKASGKDNSFKKCPSKSKVNPPPLENKKAYKPSKGNLSSGRKENFSATETFKSVEPETPLDRTPPYPDPRFSPYKNEFDEDKLELLYKDEVSKQAAFENYFELSPSKQSNPYEAAYRVEKYNKSPLKKTGGFDAGYESNLYCTTSNNEVPFSQTEFQKSPNLQRKRPASFRTRNAPNGVKESTSKRSWDLDTRCFGHGRPECRECQELVFERLWKNKTRSTVKSTDDQSRLWEKLFSIYGEKSQLVYDKLYKDWNLLRNRFYYTYCVFKNCLKYDQLMYLPLMMDYVQFDKLNR